MDYTITQVRNVLRNYEGLVVKDKGSHTKEIVALRRVEGDDAHISAEGFNKLMELALTSKDADTKLF
jgi:hypothetical protein